MSPTSVWRLWFSPLVLGLATLAACAEDLPSAWKIQDTRVLGGRLEAEGDPARAWPEAGQSATASLLVVHPSLERDNSALQTMLLQCTPAAVRVGPPICQEFLELAMQAEQDSSDMAEQLFGGRESLDCDDLADLREIVGEVSNQIPIDLFCVDGEPSFEIQVPEKLEGDALLLLGVACDRGKAVMRIPDGDQASADIFGCDFGREGKQEAGQETPFVWDIPIKTGEEDNRNPSLADAVIELDGKPWPEIPDELVQLGLQPNLGRAESDADQQGCAQAAADGLLPAVDASEHEISMSFDTEDFEEFTEDGAVETERFQIGHYTTGGDLPRTYSVVDGDDEELSFDVDWESPEDVPAAGGLVVFFFTVRDRRGGFDSTTRALCVKTE